MSEPTSPGAYPAETQLALIRRDIEDIRRALYGNGGTEKGLVDRVEHLAEVADRGRWALRGVLWLGGGLVALLTALAQVRTAVTAFWGGHN